jgi:TonB-linked SusC/RagA family outer membrane protein
MVQAKNKKTNEVFTKNQNKIMNLNSFCHIPVKSGTNWRSLIKILITMKLVMILSVLFMQQVYARVNAQTITLSCEKVSLKKIFKEINQQTGYEFLYNSQMIEKAAPVSVTLDKATISDALESCFKGQPFSYAIEGKTIVVTPKTKVQDITLRGRITDKKGNPLFGANVFIKGTLKGTATDPNGYYNIEVPENAILIFSFLGYQKIEVTFHGQSEINLVLEEGSSELAELAFVSTGYQKIRPEQSTGSLATIRARDFDTRVNTTDVLKGLENKIPGLLINNDIKFEGNSLFQIRGISTINGNKQPLIVVDGYPTELTLEMINPNEIESITILKDAAAATVYGVRASNGVIVIERKKAVIGRANVRFQATASITPKENYSRYRWDTDASNTSIDYFRTYYGNMIGPYVWYDVQNPFFGAFYNYPAAFFVMAKQAAGVITADEASQQFATLGSYNNTKDYGRLFLRNASIRTYNLDISGGDEHALYYITANYTSSDLSKIKNENNRFMLSGRTTLNLSKRLSLDLTMDFQKTKTNSVPVPDINNIYPYERFQDDDGNPLSLYYKSNSNPYYNEVLMSMGLLDNMYYPLVDINEISDKTNTLNNRITANFRYDIGHGFNFSFGGVYENSRTDTKYLASENSSEVHQYINYYTQNGSQGLIYNIPKGSFLKQQTSSTTGYTLRAQLNYDKQIAEDHSLNLILGGEVRDALDKSSSAAYFGYNDQTLIHQPVDYSKLWGPNYFPTYASANPPILFLYDILFNQGYEDNRFVSVYSNVVYSYKGKYSFTGSVRVDQSNLFGTDPKYRYKPLWSVGAAWNLHKENFMQDIDWVKSLKLRAAYGFNGNVAKKALPQVIAKAGLNNFNPSSVTSMLTLYSYANSGLRWEQTSNFNIGLDYTIFKNLTGSIDYYSRKSTDLLATNQIDASKGGTSALVNQASISNKGLEISLSADWITRKNFNWNTGLAFSYNSSKVLQVYNELTTASSAMDYINGSYNNFLEGYAIGAIFNYRYAGLNSEGKMLIYDKDGVAKEYSYDANISDIDYVGSSIPSLNAGISNRVDIGNFYAYCMINYYGGFKVRVPVPFAGDVRPLEGASNYWKQAGDENKADILPSVLYSYYSEIGNSDRYTVNGSYFTIGDLTLAYSFRDSKLLNKTNIYNLELRLQASNLYTLALNKYNYSMATGSYAKSYLTPTYSVGLYVNF